MTTAPLHTKPFNIEHARDGAPFCCANGDEVDIIKWDRNHRSCIIGLGRHDASLRMWRSDGSYSNIEDASYTLVMTPLAIIDDKPVFVGDKLVTPTGMKWLATPTCRQDNCLGDCRWPAPEKVYPETRMSWDEVMLAIDAHGRRGGLTITEGQITAIANAALRHAIERGQVMLPGDEMDDTTILKAFKDVGIHWKTDSRIDIIKAVKSLLVTEPEVEKLKRDLAKAERALVNAGFKDIGNNEWMPLTQKTKHSFGSTNSFYVEGDELSIEMVKKWAKRGEARDVDVAVAVRNGIAALFVDHQTATFNAVMRINLEDIISRVKS